MKVYGDGNAYSNLLETRRNETWNSTISGEDLCFPILFELGSMSRDGPSFKYGLCPESWFTLGISSSLLLIYSIVFFLSIVGLAVFWKDGHIRARNPICMIMTLTASSICVMLACSRMIIGRRLFPCALYLLGSLIFPQLTFMPSCIRCIRLHLMYVLNLKKTKLVEHKRIASMNISSQTDGIEMWSASPTTPTSPTSCYDAMSPTECTNLNSLNSVVSEVFVVSIENEDVNTKIEMEEDDSPRLDVKKIFSYTNQFPTTNKDQFESDVIRKVDSPPSIRVTKKVDFDTIVLDYTIDNKQLEKIEQHLEEQPSDVTTLHILKYQKQFNVLSILSSHKLIIAIYVLFLAFHIVLYFILGGAEYGYYSNTGKHLFVREDGSFFLFSHGCGVTLSFAIINGSLIGVYILAEICCLILSFFGDKDTWNIKRETIVLIIIQIFCTLYYMIGMSVPEMIKMVEFFFPSSMIFVVMSICEVVITVLLPMAYTFKQRLIRRKELGSEDSSDLCYFLSRKRTLKMFLDFARRSYCPEAVICYEHIQHYKKSSKRSRSKVALKIVETYLRLGSPLELNYPNLHKLYDSLHVKIDSNELLEIDLFDQVALHCLQDMKELFERFKNQSREVRDILASRGTFEARRNHPSQRNI